jgi:hypothetical protein
MVAKPNRLLLRIEAFSRECGGGVVVHKAARGYSLFSERTGAPIARLRPTGEGDKVRVFAWRGTRWGASGPFGVATMPLDRALDYIANDPVFWIHA